MLLRPGQALVAQPLFHAYLSEMLGKRTSGRVLNVGAGAVSSQYNYSKWFNNTEYHTLEFTGETNPTYVADVCNMPHVPSDSYDWVVSLAVLEHVRDMWAAAREIVRVLKPGGFLYLALPCHYEIHFTRSFGDYWRVTPFGFRELLKNLCAIREVEYWGDSIVDPVAVHVLAQKGATPTSELSRFIYVEGGLDTFNRFIDGSKPFVWGLPIYRLLVDGLECILKVQEVREQFFTQTGTSITHAQAEKAVLYQAARLEGTLAIRNHAAEWIPSE